MKIKVTRGGLQLIKFKNYPKIHYDIIFASFFTLINYEIECFFIEIITNFKYSNKHF